MRRRTEETSINSWQCEHVSPVVVEEVVGGKSARCLLCGERGPVREGTKEALRATQGSSASA